MECPNCNGAGCEECNDGAFELDGCPGEYCSRVVTAINLIDLYTTKGLMPVSGGVLDQSASFIGAARFFQNEEVRISNERINRHTD